MILSLFLFLLSLVARVINALPNGAPICENRPPHGDERPPASSPHRITISAHCYNPGQKINVTLEGEEVFHGFVLETPAGTFNSGPEFRASCGRYALTHRNKDSKTSITTIWIAPRENVGPYALEMKATTFRSYSGGSTGEFWHLGARARIPPCNPTQGTRRVSGPRHIEIPEDMFPRTGRGNRVVPGAVVKDCWALDDKDQECYKWVIGKPNDCYDSNSYVTSNCKWSCCRHVELKSVIPKDQVFNVPPPQPPQTFARQPEPIFPKPQPREPEPFFPPPQPTIPPFRPPVQTRPPFIPPRPVDPLPPPFIPSSPVSGADCSGLFDDNNVCPVWVEADPGQCDRPRSYENIGCKFSCCKKTGRRPGNGVSSKGGVGCHTKTDKRSECPKWVSARPEVCSNVFSFESVNCELSCCQPPTASGPRRHETSRDKGTSKERDCKTAFDKDPGCPDWVKAAPHNCDSSSTFEYDNCRYSCCNRKKAPTNTGTISNTLSAEDCLNARDSEFNCPDWVSASPSKCDDPNAYEANKCKLSCCSRKCKGLTDDDPNCQSWISLSPDKCGDPFSFESTGCSLTCCIATGTGANQKQAKKK